MSVVTVTQVEKKEGTSKGGKPYTKYIVHASGEKYSTFDAALYNAATGLVGRQADIVYETGQYGNDLKAITPVAGAPEPTPEPARDITSTGAPDWDLIGLRKTRCALWAAFLSGPFAASLQKGEVEHVGRSLVMAAEEDIFWRVPAQRDDSIPF